MAKELAVEKYKKYSDFDKEELIKNYLPLVKKVVHRLASRLPKVVDLKEMINSGIIGLVDAFEKFDPDQCPNFGAYAKFRIRGSIIDSFRTQDHLPRTLRSRTMKIEKAFNTLEQKLGRPVNELEVAEFLEMDIKDLRKYVMYAGNMVMCSFDDLGYGTGDERYKTNSKTEDDQSPLSQILGTERVHIMSRALDRLPEKERLVVSLYYYEELSLKEIGQILEVTESRASQIRSRALLRLKSNLDSFKELD